MTYSKQTYDHLLERGVNFNTSSPILDGDYSYFLLWNLSGKLTGYVRYKWNGIKSGKDRVPIEDKKYKLWKSANELAIYGLETYNVKDRVVFVVEGIFDAIKIHNAGFCAIAILTNSPTKDLISWFYCLPQKIVTISDNDAAGKSINRLGIYRFNTPGDFKDLGEMDQDSVNMFLKDILETINI